MVAEKGRRNTNLEVAVIFFTDNSKQKENNKNKNSLDKVFIWILMCLDITLKAHDKQQLFKWVQLKLLHTFRLMAMKYLHPFHVKYCKINVKKEE